MTDREERCYIPSLQRSRRRYVTFRSSSLPLLSLFQGLSRSEGFGRGFVVLLVGKGTRGDRWLKSLMGHRSTVGPCRPYQGQIIVTCFVKDYRTKYIDCPLRPMITVE